MNTENRKIKIFAKNGEFKEFEVIAYINIESGNYVVYTDNQLANNGDVLMHVNCLVKENDEVSFEEVTEDELKEVIAKLQERVMINNGKV